jgi:F420-dependent oxidoreductase-like protein
LERERNRAQKQVRLLSRRMGDLATKAEGAGEAGEGKDHGWVAEVGVRQESEHCQEKRVDQAGERGRRQGPASLWRSVSEHGIGAQADRYEQQADEGCGRARYRREVRGVTGWDHVYGAALCIAAIVGVFGGGSGQNARMELRIMVEPQQGASYDEQLRVAKHAEKLGFAAFIRSDHLLRMGGGDPGPGPTDSWVTLAGLARETSHIRLGTLMTSATFRLPGMLAVQVAEVDVMSGGRVELGFGAGWFQAEHDAYGIPFPGVEERFDRFEEQLAIITGLWATANGERFTYKGRYYQLEDCPALPRPVQRPRPPVIIGGTGPRRTPELAAAYADEFNVPFASVEKAREQIERVRAACRKAGRDPSSMVYSIAAALGVGKDDAEARRRGEVNGADFAELRAGAGLVGTVGEVIERLKVYEAMGVSRSYLQLNDLQDMDQLDLVAGHVMPKV